MVIRKLFLARQDGLLVDELHRGLFAADADGIRGRTGTACREVCEGMLSSAVFKRVEGDDGDSALRIQVIRDRLQRRFDDGKLGIHFDADRLEGLFRRVVSDSEQLFGRYALDDIDQLRRRFDRLFRACLDEYRYIVLILDDLMNKSTLIRPTNHYPALHHLEQQLTYLLFLNKRYPLAQLQLNPQIPICH